MAISTAYVLQALSLGQFRGGLQPVLQLPLLKNLNVTAAGLTEFLQPGAKAFRVQNPGADLWFKVNLTGDAVAATPNDSASIFVAANSFFDFALDKDVKAETVKLSFA